MFCPCIITEQSEGGFHCLHALPGAEVQGRCTEPGALGSGSQVTAGKGEENKNYFTGRTTKLL